MKSIFVCARKDNMRHFMKIKTKHLKNYLIQCFNLLEVWKGIVRLKIVITVTRNKHIIITTLNCLEHSLSMIDKLKLDFNRS